MQKTETELAIEHLQQVGAASIKEMIGNAGRVGNVEVTWDGLRFEVPSRSLHRRANGEAFPLSGEIQGSVVYVDAPGGGRSVVDRLSTLLQVVSCGTTGSAFTDKAQTWQKFCDTLPWGSIDLDTEFVAVTRDLRQGAPVFKSLDEGLRHFGLRAGEGFLTATVRGRTPFQATQAAKELPAEAWERKLIDPFGEITDHG